MALHVNVDQNNHLMGSGYAYDANGNMTLDATIPHTYGRTLSSIPA
jgi:hypothetical protein